MIWSQCHFAPRPRFFSLYNIMPYNMRTCPNLARIFVQEFHVHDSELQWPGSEKVMRVARAHEAHSAAIEMCPEKS